MNVQGGTSQGIMLNTVTRMSLRCSLKVLQDQVRAEAIYFLGEIFGYHNDYYLAFSVEKNYHLPDIFFCSTDYRTWTSVTRLSPELAEEASKIRDPFSGILTTETTLPSGVTVTEEQRLGAFFASIYENCLLVPRSALIYTAMDYVIPNPLWTGLDVEACGYLSSYRHWRLPQRPQTLLEKSLSNPAYDHLEPLESNTEWQFGIRTGTNEVVLKNIRWPGFTFSINNNEWSNLYFGNGVSEELLLYPQPETQEEEEDATKEEEDDAKERSLPEEGETNNEEEEQKAEEESFKEKDEQPSTETEEPVMEPETVDDPKEETEPQPNESETEEPVTEPETVDDTKEETEPQTNEGETETGESVTEPDTGTLSPSETD